MSPLLPSITSPAGKSGALYKLISLLPPFGLTMVVIASPTFSDGGAV